MHGTFQITTKLFLMDGNHLLILNDRKSGTGDLPGGRLTQAEIHMPWTEALLREVVEELGPKVRISIQRGPLFAFPHWIVESAQDAMGLAFRGSYLGGPIVLSEEHDSFRWVPIHSYDPDGTFSPTLALALKRFAAEVAGGFGRPGFAARTT